MTKRLLVMVACICCLALIAVAAQAAPNTGVTRGPVMRVPQGPDLVIQEIIIREQSSGEFSTVRVSVRVRNKGDATAGASEVMLLYTHNIMGTHYPAVVQHATVGLIPAGGYQEVDFMLEGIAGPLRGMLVAAADVPVAGSPTGQVREGRRLLTTTSVGTTTDLNNGFAVIFDCTGRTLPVRFKNPAVQ